MSANRPSGSLSASKPSTPSLKTSPKPSKPTFTLRTVAKKSPAPPLKEVFADERTHYIIGLVFCIFAFYLLLAFASFLFSQGADQSAVSSLPLGNVIADHYALRNWGGACGAYLSDLFINRGFGIPSFIILAFLFILGGRLMGLNKQPILKRFLFCTSSLIWCSIFLAFVFARTSENTFLYPGGKHGHAVTLLLTSTLGSLGLALFLLATFLVIAIFSSSRTIPILRTLLSSPFRLKRHLSKTKAGAHTVKKLPIAPPLTQSEPPDDDLPISDDDLPISDDDSFQVIVPPDEETFHVIVPSDPETYSPLNELGEYDPTLDLSLFRNPNLDLLKHYDNDDRQVDMDEQNANKDNIKQTLLNFSIGITSIQATVGPTITLYEVVPEAGVRISKIRNLEDDIALSLKALGIRIIAPMPGKGTIGIEVPNKNPQIVSMQSILSSRRFQECRFDLPIALGKTISNEIFLFDLCKMPHLLVAGATGQGKSVGLNAIITSLLYKKHPAELKFVLVDPKMVEFSIYAEIERHYLAKLPDAEKAIITDVTKVVYTLNSLCSEMDERYDLLMKAHTRNVKEYNDKFRQRRLNPEKGHRFMPYIVVIIDEFGDLIMTAGKEIELPIARIAQKARAVGIHMIIATQRPSVNIITGTIKANFPARIAFRVSSMIDSRTILDAPGANQLIGRGDLLFSQGSEMVRVQCAFIDTPEVEQISNYIGDQVGFPTAHLLPEYHPDGEDDNKLADVDLTDRDPLFDDSARLLVTSQQGSTSLIQRKFSIGYNRAGRIMDQLEKAGVVGPFEGSKPRQILIQDPLSLENLLASLG
ncbi:MAG: DNA translocase FtsK [Tannerellaceae bacterium]|nr:DNA translocase FtsK [Tannerellaceae bacterium]